MIDKVCKYCGSKKVSKKMGGWLCLDCRKFEVYREEELNDIVTDKEIKSTVSELERQYTELLAKVEDIDKENTKILIQKEILQQQLLATKKKLEEYEQAHIMSCNLINSQDNKIVDLQQKLDKAVEALEKIIQAQKYCNGDVRFCDDCEIMKKYGTCDVVEIAKQALKGEE